MAATGITVTFPAFDSLPTKTVYWGTRDFECDGLEFKSVLADVPRITFQRGTGQNSSDFVVNDRSNLIYKDIAPYLDVVEDAEVVIRECLKTEAGIFESEIAFIGFLETMRLSDSSISISFTAINDLSRTGFLTAGRILTQRNCAAKFNINGLNDPLYDACGWTTAQGGNALSCTHKREGTDGCIDHNNEWRYLAVEALTSAEIQTYAGGSGGWTYGDCFVGSTTVWCADDVLRRIDSLSKGQLIWVSTPEGVLVKRPILEVFSNVAAQTIQLDLGNDDSLQSSPEHMIAIANDVFRCAQWLDPGDTVRSFTKDRYIDLAVRSTLVVNGNTKVYNLLVDEFHNYHVGRRKVKVHNAKPVGDI